jgi:hypothetical protein
VRCDPAQIKPLAFEQACYRFDQHRKRRTSLDVTGMMQGQDLLHPAFALLTACSLAVFVPQYSK